MCCHCQAHADTNCSKESGGRGKTGTYEQQHTHHIDDNSSSRPHDTPQALDSTAAAEQAVPAVAASVCCSLAISSPVNLPRGAQFSPAPTKPQPGPVCTMTAHPCPPPPTCLLTTLPAPQPPLLTRCLVRSTPAFCCCRPALLPAGRCCPSNAAPSCAGRCLGPSSSNKAQTMNQQQQQQQCG